MNQGNVPPEVVAAYMQQLSLEEQDQDLQHQMALAREMMQPGPQRYGALGQGLQSIADVMNAYKGGNTMRGAQAGRETNRGQRQQGRSAIAEHWLGTQQAPPPGSGEAPIPEGVEGPLDFSGMDPQVDAQSLIPEMLRRPPEQMAPPPGGDLTLPVAPVPPPLNAKSTETTANYKKRQLANRG